jgi:hypothetical protein
MEAVVFLSRKPARALTSWLNPRLRVESLEDRAVPATLFVDDGLVAGTAIGSLSPSVQVTDDRDNSGTLSTGDQVRVAVGETGQTTHLTFNATPTGGDAGAAYATIGDAVAAASAGDTVAIAKGTYAEAVTVDKKLTLDGLTNTAADVGVDPATGAAVTVTADGVTVRDLTLAPAAGTGLMVPASAIDVADLTLSDVTVTTAAGSAGAGLDLTGNASAGSTLSLTGVTVTVGANGTGAPVAVSGFETVNLTDLVDTDVATATAGTIALPTGSTTATVNVAATGATPTTFTASGTSLQLGPTGGMAGAAITLANVDRLNLTGTAVGDTFDITPSATGGAAVTVNGGLPTGATGDTLSVNLAGLTGTAVNNLTSTASGLAGTFAFTNAANVAFTGIESLPNVAVVTGTVFNDLNGNGTRDSDEAGVAGVTVQLDAGADGSVDQTATTDAQGHYAFAVLTAGTERVRVVLPAGVTLTTADPADVTAALGATAQGGNFGLNFGTGASGTSTVTGVAFNDANANGTQDAGEVGVDNLVVYLDLNGNGKFDKKTEPATLTRTVGGVAGSFTLTSDVAGTTARVRAVEKPGFLENTTSSTVALTAGATQTVNVGVRADLPPQATPARLFAEGVVVGNKATVVVRDGKGKEVFSVPAGTGEVRVATGDVTGDGVDDVIIVNGPGSQVTVTVIDGATQKQVFSGTPFDTFAGGAFVTVGDVNQDGIDDIIVTPDESGGPRVVVISGGNFQTILSFFGIDDPNFRGGARAGFADLNGDGRPDLIVAAGFGGGPRVSVLDGAALHRGQFRHLLNDFFVFDPVLRNGVFVTGSDFDGDGFDDLVFGAGPGGAPRVLVISGQLLQTQGVATALASPLGNFFAGSTDNRGGVHVLARDLDWDGRPELVTADGAGRRVAQYDDDFRQKSERENESDDRGSKHGVFVG